MQETKIKIIQWACLTYATIKHIASSHNWRCDCSPLGTCIGRLRIFVPQKESFKTWVIDNNHTFLFTKFQRKFGSVLNIGWRSFSSSLTFIPYDKDMLQSMWHATALALKGTQPFVFLEEICFQYNLLFCVFFKLVLLFRREIDTRKTVYLWLG